MSEKLKPTLRTQQIIEKLNNVSVIERQVVQQWLNSNLTNVSEDFSKLTIDDLQISVGTRNRLGRMGFDTALDIYARRQEIIEGNLLQSAPKAKKEVLRLLSQFENKA